MFYILTIAAFTFFIVHVALLLMAFPKSKLAKTRYFYSHLTLWIAGILLFVIAQLYSGTGRSSFLDYFNSSTKTYMILVFTAVLSLVAHGIVNFLIVPALRKNYLNRLS